MLSFENLRKDEEVLSFIEKANRVLGEIGYTEHGMAHAVKTGEDASRILATLGYDEHICELAKIAGLLHDIGKAIDHEQEGSHIQLGVEGLPLEMIPLVLETSYSHERYEFCKILIDKGLFPHELKEEFLYDCDKNVRELFLKTQKPKKQPYNVFLKPPKMPEE